MTHRRLAGAQKKRQVAHTKLIRKAEGMKDPRPSRIGQQGKGFGDARSHASIDHPAQERTHMLRMETLDVTLLAS